MMVEIFPFVVDLNLNKQTGWCPPLVDSQSHLVWRIVNAVVYDLPELRRQHWKCAITPQLARSQTGEKFFAHDLSLDFVLSLSFFFRSFFHIFSLQSICSGKAVERVCTSSAIFLPSASCLLSLTRWKTEYVNEGGQTQKRGVNSSFRSSSR